MNIRQEAIQEKSSNAKKCLAEGYYKEFHYKILFNYQEHNNHVTFHLILSETLGNISLEKKHSYSGFSKQELFDKQGLHLNEILDEGKKIIDDLDFPVYEDYMTLQYPSSLLYFKSKEEYDNALHSIMTKRNNDK